jgi:hypothetical protein
MGVESRFNSLCIGAAGIFKGAVDDQIQECELNIYLRLNANATFLITWNKLHALYIPTKEDIILI